MKTASLNNHSDNKHPVHITVFFFNDTATTEIYTLSLHDALPIYHRVRLEECGEEPARAIGICLKEGGIAPSDVQYIHYHGTSTELNDRSEEHTSELQSLRHL